MESGRGGRPGSTGAVVILLGAAGFLVSCFLPFIATGAPSSGSLSFFRLVTVGPAGPVATTGSVLHLFVGPVALASIAAVEILRPRAGTVAALLAVSIVWSLTQIGALISWLGFYGRREPAIGFWLMAGSVGVVIAGTAWTWFAMRRGEVLERQTQPMSRRPNGI